MNDQQMERWTCQVPRALEVARCLGADDALAVLHSTKPDESKTLQTVDIEDIGLGVTPVTLKGPIKAVQPI